MFLFQTEEEPEKPIDPVPAPTPSPAEPEPTKELTKIEPEPAGETKAPESTVVVEPTPTEPSPTTENNQTIINKTLTSNTVVDPPVAETVPTSESVFDPLPVTELSFPLPLVLNTPKAKLEPLLDPALNIKEEKLFSNEHLKSGNGVGAETEERPDQADMDGASALAALASAASIAQNTVKQETNGIKNEIDEVRSSGTTFLIYILY